jgi:aryl-alcohol dehydrogenase-like predicted oxidoreductase
MSVQTNTINRRGFLKTTAAATVAGAAAATARPVRAEDNFVYRNYQPDKMAYARLGKTNFMCSRLTFGCGAALMTDAAVRLVERAFEQGVNHFDVGTTVYYKGSEKRLAPFLKAHRDEVWVTSKGMAPKGVGGSDDLNYDTEMAKTDAVYWTGLLEGSLKDLEQEHVDAYYLMGVGNPNCVKSEEMYNAFQAAKQAGKVDHFGISTHKRAGACLEAAIECGWHSQAMIAITPSGWYDWDTKQLLGGTPPMTSLKPIIEKAKAADIGLVGMKAARFIAPGRALGKGDETAFDSVYKAEFLKSGLSPFQRSYAYCLAHGMDTVNADMQNFAHFEENLIAARDFEKYTSMMA